MRFGATAEIELHGYVGFTRHKSSKKLSAWQECAIVASGPLADLVLAGASAYLLLRQLPASYHISTLSRSFERANFGSSSI